MSELAEGEQIPAYVQPPFRSGVDTMSELAEGEQIPAYVQPPFRSGVDTLEELSKEWFIHPNEVSAALEWGLENDNEFVQTLHKSSRFGLWDECGNDVRMLEGRRLDYDGDVNYIFRRSVIGSTSLTVGNLVHPSFFGANQNFVQRSGYGKALQKINAESNEVRQQSNHMRGKRALGELGAGGMTFVAEKLLIVGSQTADIILGGLAIGITGEGLGWVYRRSKTWLRRRGAIRDLQNPTLPDNAEQEWQRLYPYFEKIVEAYNPEYNEGDVRIFDERYVMQIEGTRQKLEQSAELDVEDYADVLDYLAAKAKETADITSKTWAKSDAKSCELYPLTIVKDMIKSSKGMIWNGEFATTITRIAETQLLFYKKNIELNQLKLVSKSPTIGMQNAQKIESLKTDISRINDTLGLCLLDLLKINHEYHTNQDGPSEGYMPTITDPYTAKRLTKNYQIFARFSGGR